MQRIAVAANEDLRIRAYGINRLQLGQNFFVRDLLLIEIEIAVLVHGQADVLAFVLGLTRSTSWQGHLDALHMHLAQAHHHETGEQKEHDVDQRNDLDPRSLVRNWRAYVHWIP